MEPMTLIMLGMVGLLIIFMIRNGKKRKEQIAALQAGIQPGAEVMLQSGIYGFVEDIDDEEQKLTLRSGTSLLVVHRSAVMNVVTPVDAPIVEEELAPDDDPSFHRSVDEARETTESPEGSDRVDGDSSEPEAK